MNPLPNLTCQPGQAPLLLLAVLLGTGALDCWAASIIQFSAATYSVTEDASELSLGVQRTNDLNTAVSVNVATGTAGSAVVGMDFAAMSTNLTFKAQETNRIVKVAILNDGQIESLKTVQLLLSNPTGGAELGPRGSATVRITDNDKGLQLELSAYSVNEDAGLMTFRVVRRDDGDYPVSVDFATTNLTGVAGVDYLDTVGTLSFGAQEALKYVTVTLLNDAVRESNETFRITLSNPTDGGVLGTPPAATVTIIDTDDLVQFQATSHTNREDAEWVRIAVVRGESTMAATVDVATTNGTALASQDYVGLTQMLSFAPGERLKVVDVPLLHDDLKESSENFRVVLSNPTGGAVLGSRSTIIVTILDNDPGVGFEQGAYSVWESDREVSVPVLRGTDGQMVPFRVDYATADSTALAGVDYQSIAGSLEFKENETVRRLTIPLLNNPAVGLAKAFTLVLIDRGDHALSRRGP